MRNISTSRQQPDYDKTRQKETAKTSKARSVLESFEYIVELAENSNLDADFMERAGTHIRYASRRLKLTPLRTVLLALFVDRSEDQRIMMSELAGYTGCRTTKFLRLVNDIEALEKMRYIRAARDDGSVTYRVPAEALAALRRNEPYVHTVEPLTDTQSFFDRFNSLMQEKNSNELSHDALLATTRDMLDEIADTQFARALKGCNLTDHDTLLFIYMAHLFVENNDDNIVFNDIENIYDNDRIPSWRKREMRDRDNTLFAKRLIENVNDDGLARADAWKLTDHAKQELLGELKITCIGRKSDGNLTRHDTLAEKHLIYNAEERGQIEQLSSILSEQRFAEVQTRLREAGMRQGFCCLFYGAPGTGKTETVYQLARATGRDIMQVDVDKVKSCWVGESEKNIKAVFTRYRSVCKNSEKAPILLFNEADAVLGVRMEGASSAVDKMENSIQNIILQEMESLEGIMIATTNLTSNLDKAFERRFLYKVRFERPTAEARAEIWRGMLPGLSAPQAAKLAGMFDLSGGEIENIARKHSVNAILKGTDLIDLDEIAETCRRERIATRSARIGF